MDFLRKAVVFVAASTLTLVLFLNVTFTALSTTVSPNNIKNWLKNSDVYDGAVDAILDSTAKAAQKNTKENNDVFSNPEVKNAINKAFPGSLLRSSTESFIDGTFKWLDGTAQKPTYKIDLTKAKKDLANNLADYAQSRYKTLPICKSIPSKDTDPLNATCRIPGYNITNDLNKFKKELISNKDIFGDPPIITANSFTTGEDKQPFYEQAKALPSAYKFLKIAPFIFGLISLVSLAIVLFLSKEKRNGFKRAAISLASTAGVLVLTTIVLHFLISGTRSRLADSGNSSNAFVQKTGLSIAEQVGTHIEHVNLVFAVIFLAAAIALFIMLKKVKSLAPPTSYEKPKPVK